MKQGYKSMLERWGLEGWFSAACQAMGAWNPRVFQMKMWKIEIFMGSSEADIDSGTRTPESLSPQILHAYPSLLLFSDILPHLDICPRAGHYRSDKPAVEALGNPPNLAILEDSSSSLESMFQA